MTYANLWPDWINIITAKIIFMWFWISADRALYSQRHFKSLGAHNLHLVKYTCCFLHKNIQFESCFFISYDSWAAMTCEKVWSDQIIGNKIRGKCIFIRFGLWTHLGLWNRPQHLCPTAVTEVHQTSPVKRVKGWNNNIITQQERVIQHVSWCRTNIKMCFSHWMSMYSWTGSHSTIYINKT